MIGAAVLIVVCTIAILLSVAFGYALGVRNDHD